jgi:hypothetical protein
MNKYILMTMPIVRCRRVPEAIIYKKKNYEHDAPKFGHTFDV